MALFWFQMRSYQQQHTQVGRESGVAYCSNYALLNMPQNMSGVTDRNFLMVRGKEGHSQW